MVKKVVLCGVLPACCLFSFREHHFSCSLGASLILLSVSVLGKADPDLEGDVSQAWPV